MKKQEINYLLECIERGVMYHMVKNQYRVHVSSIIQSFEFDTDIEVTLNELPENAVIECNSELECRRIYNLLNFDKELVNEMLKMCRFDQSIYWGVRVKDKCLSRMDSARLEHHKYKIFNSKNITK